MYLEVKSTRCLSRVLPAKRSASSLDRNGRAARRPAGPDDGSRLGPQGADAHRKQVRPDAAPMLCSCDQVF